MKLRHIPFLVTVAVAATIATPVTARVPTLDPERGVMTMAPLLDEITPAVVNISVRVRTPTQENPLLRDPFFQRFFDVPERQPERQHMSAGSGVIVDAEKGYVVTNHHVIDKAEEITVTLKDSRRFKAELVGSDPETDIALLKIEPERLQALPLADSVRLKVGDIVFAIGNPFGLGQTVTSGIVSALGRGIGMHGYEDFIQTDAPINPGNSGGALVNSKGELVGVNTAIIAPGGGNVGIGFAVPASMASSVIDQLLRHGEVRRGRIGVYIQDLTPDLAEALGLETAKGAVISQVEAGSPAERAGLQAGDVVVEVDDAPIEDAGDLRNRVGLVERGGKIAIEYIRDGKPHTLTVEVGEVITASLSGGQTSPQLAGAEFTNIPEDHPAYGNITGILVAQVARGSSAWQFGLREGDIIHAVNRQPVKSVTEFRQTVEANDRILALNVVRGNSQLFLVIR